MPFYYEHFAPRDYHAHPQNWSITQDSRGIIYVGNYDGILAYDGATWQLIRTPTNSTVRSLAADTSGRVYVGLQGDFGYVTSDSTGDIRYKSLASELREEFRGFRDVWNTHVDESQVYFQTKNSLIRWNGETFKVWNSVHGFHTSFRVGGEIYVREKGVGIRKVSGDNLILIDGGDKYADKQIFMLAKHPEGGLLVATQKDGFTRLKDGRVRPIKTDLDEWMHEHRLYHGASLRNGYYALAFLDGGGVAIVNSAGRLVDAFSEGAGLPDGWVNSVFVDAQDGLWMALNNKGIIRIDVPSALTKFDSRNGLEGVISDIGRVNEKVFAATSTGLYSLEGESTLKNRPSFGRIAGIASATNILAVESGLLAATHDGLIHVDEDNTVQMVAKGAFFVISPSKHNPTIVYLGSKTGISIAHFDGRAWTGVQEIVTLNKEAYSLVESEARSVWVTTRENDVFRIQFSSTWSVIDIEDYSVDEGSVSGHLSAAVLDDRVIFAAKDGLFVPHTSATKSRLRKVDGFSDQVGLADTLLYFTLTEDDELWKVYPNRIDIAIRRNGRYEVRTPLLLSELALGKPVRLEVEDSGVAWISSGSMLVRYDPSLANHKTYDAPFPAILRRITTIDSDQQLFGGAFINESGGLTSTQQASLVPSLAFEQNALRFEFTLPSYNDVSRNQFQYYLEGKDEGWSEWTSENSKNYTNLGEATYRFHVRGRNAQGFVSDASVYTFTILPPWYRSVWAYSAYLMALLGVGLFARRHLRIVAENKHAKEQAIELAKEREVNERLNDLNRRLQQANESLLQADRLKDEFLANTSHELRTPLTGILGCAAILREEVTEEQTEFIDMIDENGQRLLHTLDSLLDLARLRAGLMELRYDDVDVGATSFDIAQSYLPVAEKKAVNLEVKTEGDVKASIDGHCLECVLNHLIGNAVKFTDDGCIDISVKRDVNMIVLSVADTGIGIDEEFLPFLFDEFKQESTGLTRSHEGNGLGLAVTAKLVDLMGGEIEVESRKGAGTTFTVHLPVQQAAEKHSGDGQANQPPQISLGSAGEQSDRAAA